LETVAGVRTSGHGAPVNSEALQYRSVAVAARTGVRALLETLDGGAASYYGLSSLFDVQRFMCGFMQGAPMREPRSGVRYRLSKPVRAVKLQEHPGSSLRNPTETLVEIPANSVIELEGVAAPSVLSNVLWKGEAFSVFYEDLEDNGQILVDSEVDREAGSEGDAADG